MAPKKRSNFSRFLEIAVLVISGLEALGVSPDLIDHAMSNAISASQKLNDPITETPKKDNPS